jgi:type I restriction enzyme R subunit
MRRALPNAAFIGFTGTPLMAGEELTREVFGDYVSTYNFARSIEDRATVPLYYENRIPEVQISNADLGDDLAQLLDEAELDEDQEKKLERDFARQYHIITRDDRLVRIAEDVVKHFVGRGYRGKAMFIALDKATAVRMYDKVRRYWSAYIAALEARRAKADDDERAELDAAIAWMRETDMAVVVSQSQNELAEMKAKGLDIRPHRKRMVTEDLDEKFKDADNPFRLVFVCAMWITGFDVPSCSTIYLDKPMKNHSLMQAIARANRVMPGKTAGVIVDYVGVFRNLQRALAIYAQSGTDGGSPVEDKAALVETLKKALKAALDFCGRRGVTVAPILAAKDFARVKAIQDAADALMGTDGEQAQILQLAGDVWKLYKAVLPDERAVEFAPDAVVLQVLAERILSLMPKPDITAVRSEIEALLDRSIAGIRIKAPIRDDLDQLFDLSRIDFEKLAILLKGGRTRSKLQALRTGIERKLADMVRQNPARTVLLERFQKMVDEYNAGSVSAEELLKQLLDFVKSLSEEDQRAVREALSEEELAIFDILTKPEPKLSRDDEIEVKKVARSLLEKLKREKLVLDWRRKEQARAAVRQAIGIELDTLPPAYSADIYRRKCELAYQYVFEHYPDANTWTGAPPSVH